MTLPVNHQNEDTYQSAWEKHQDAHNQWVRDYKESEEQPQADIWVNEFEQSKPSTSQLWTDEYSKMVDDDHTQVEMEHLTLHKKNQIFINLAILRRSV